MKRHATLPTLILLMAWGGATAAETTKPNLLILHCHDLGQHLGCYGVKTVHSPNIDKLASEGIRFSRSFCSQPGCSASRASLFTGRFPHSNGVMGLCHKPFAWDLHPEEKHLAQYMKEASYSTTAIGVVHETHSGAKRCGYEKHIADGMATKAADAALAELPKLAAADRPFYLFVGTVEPHRLPYPEGSEYLAGEHGFPGPHLKSDESLGVQIPGYLKDTQGTRGELAGLQGAIRHADEQFGRILKAIDADENLRRNTIVVFTTDHGIAMPRAKCSVYEPGLQVALIVRYPARAGWHGGKVHDEMISNIDVLPSLLELLGIAAASNVQGRSFAPLLDGRTYRPNEVIFGELTDHDFYDPQRSVRTETHKLIANFTSAKAFMDPSQQWRPRSDTITPANPAASRHENIELYDLVKDPWEQQNVAKKPEYAEACKQLTARLYKQMSDTNDPLLKGAVTSPMHEKTVELLRSQ